MIILKPHLDSCMMDTEDNFIIGSFFFLILLLFYKYKKNIFQGVRHFIQKNFDDFYISVLVHIWYKSASNTLHNIFFLILN